MKGIVKERQPFERLEMKKSDLLEMFKVNIYRGFVFEISRLFLCVLYVNDVNVLTVQRVQAAVAQREGAD